MKKYNLNSVRKDLKIVYSDNNAISVIFQNNDVLMGVVGELDSNLKELEKLSKSSNFQITIPTPSSSERDYLYYTFSSKENILLKLVEYEK